MEIDPKTGLPIEAMSWDDLAKADQKITIIAEKRRYGKVTTIVSGFDNGVDLKGIARSLKEALACGGTVKDGVIELQGDHLRQVKNVLIRLGFSEDSIND